MAVTITHTFQSPKGDSPDASLVQPSHWNDEHKLTLGGQKLLGRGNAASGPAEEITVGSGLTLSTGRVLSTLPDTMNPDRLLGRYDDNVGAKQEIQVGVGLELTSSGFLRNQNLLPVGIIMDFAANAAPDGWAICDGHLLSRTIHEKLATLITTTFGPYCDENGTDAGTTHFRLPDLRARMTVGRDTQDNAAPGKYAGRINNSGDGHSGINARTIGGYTTGFWGIPHPPAPAPQVPTNVGGVAGSEKSALTNANQIPPHGHMYRTNADTGEINGGSAGLVPSSKPGTAGVNHLPFVGTPDSGLDSLIGTNWAPTTPPTTPVMKAFNTLPPIMVVNKIIYHGVYT